MPIAPCGVYVRAGLYLGFMMRCDGSTGSAAASTAAKAANTRRKEAFDAEECRAHPGAGRPRAGAPLESPRPGGEAPPPCAPRGRGGGPGLGEAQAAGGDVAAVVEGELRTAFGLERWCAVRRTT